MSIFDSGVRNDQSPQRFRESSYDFYNRASGPEYQEARSRIDYWISKVPQEHRGGVINKLKARNDDQAHSALWHCFLNTGFLEQGFTVQFEPQFRTADGVLLNPDLVIEKDGDKYVVDAAVIFERGEHGNRLASQNRIVDEINNRLSERQDGKFLAISFDEEEELQNLRIRRFADALDSWLDSLPDTANGAEFEHRDGGWTIRLEYVADGRDESGRILGLINSGVFQGDATRDSHDIRDVVKVKTSRYRPLGLPVIPAIHVQRRFMSDNDIRCALYGNLGAGEAADRKGFVDKRVQGDLDGVWATKDGPDRAWSPAVITVDKMVDLPSDVQLFPKVWLHPWADSSVQGVFAWDEIVMDESTRTGVRAITKSRT